VQMIGHNTIAKQLDFLLCPPEFHFFFYGFSNPALQKKRAPVRGAKSDEIDVGFAPIIKILEAEGFSGSDVVLHKIQSARSGNGPYKNDIGPIKPSGSLGERALHFSSARSGIGPYNYALITESGSTVAALQEGMRVATV